MTKIQLSPEEMQLVTNSEWILTKHRVIDKVYHLFGSLSDQMQLYLQEKNGLYPSGLLQFAPKISKGEQYEALPYVVLDYPRVFSKEDVFAVRSFFWWGNYFSITLHLKGKYREQYGRKIAAAMTENKLEGYYYSFSGGEFNFDLRGKNYQRVNDITEEKYAAMEQADFLKISYQISFKHWNSVEQTLMQVFRHCMQLLAD